MGGNILSQADCPEIETTFWEELFDQVLVLWDTSDQLWVPKVSALRVCSTVLACFHVMYLAQPPPDAFLEGLVLRPCVVVCWEPCLYPLVTPCENDFPAAFFLTGCGY